MEDWMKPKPTDGPVSRYINRRISTLITKAILKSGLPITPNQMTLISLLVSIMTAYLIWADNLLVGGIMVQVSSIIDGVDGELARARGTSSKLGAFLDATADRVADIAIIIAVAHTALSLNLAASEALLIISMLALSADMMVSYIHARGEASLGIHPAKIGVVKGIAGRDVRLLMLAVLVAASRPLLALVSVSALAYTYVTAKIIEILSLKERIYSSFM